MQKIYPSIKRSLLLGLMAIAFAACSNGHAEVEEIITPVVETPPINVETQNLETHTFIQELRLVGDVRSDDMATLSAQVGSTVMSVRRDRGAKVQKGDTLLVLDTQRYRAAADIAEAQLASAELDFNSAKRLWEEGQGISETDFMKATHAVKIAQASADLARADLRDCYPQAPFDGIIAERFVNRGELVGPGGPLLQIVASSKLRVRCGVPEGQISRVRKGMEAIIRIPEANIELRENVSWVGAVLVPRDRALPLEIELSTPPASLKPGMACQVDLLNSSGEDCVSVPLHIVQQAKNHHFVFVEEAGQAKQRTVMLGARNAQGVEILEGLNAGEKLIVAGYRNLVDGHPVRVIKQN
jgi:membrane fusion protein, multidrug efflux system